MGPTALYDRGPGLGLGRNSTLGLRQFPAGLSGGGIRDASGRAGGLGNHSRSSE